MQKINVDLNSLFNLSYNFENLKLLLTTISKNQDMFENKMKDIEKKMKDNETKIEQILSGELEINKQTNLDNINTFIIEQSAKPPTPKKDTNTKDIINTNNTEEKTQKKKEIKEIDYDKNMEDIYNYKMNKENKIILNDIDSKILSLEEKIKLLYNFIPSFPEDKTKTLNDILDEHQMNINNSNYDIKEIKDKMNKMKNNLDEMLIKVNEFNIYDLFKDITDSGGDIEASKILIQALDKKTQERFKFQDEKIKNDEQETLKIKTEITNLKNNSSFEKRNLTTIKEQIIKLQSEIDLNKKTISEKITKNKEEIDNIKEKDIKKIEKIHNEVKDSNNQINNLFNIIKMIKEDIEKEKELRKKKEEDEENSFIPQKIDESNFVNIDKFTEFKETTLKKINSLDRKYQSLNSEMKNDFFENEINSIKIELNNKKPTQQEFYNLNVQVQQFSELFENMKEDNSNLQSDMRKCKDTIAFLTKKYETVILQAMNVNKSHEQTEESKIIERNNILTKFDEYVEITIFNEFIKEQARFTEKLKKDFDSYKHFYDEIIETLKKAASIQDLKNLEEYFVDLLDEFKDKSNKFYTKKSDINKSFKSIELQIKQIYEYLNKKDEQSDNWMLAKKPLGGFSCASCETYIGDLKENNEKVFWNQLPDREIVSINSNNNNNKIGNGFSRILNLININKEIKKDNLFTNSLTKADYGDYKKEIISKKNSGPGGLSEPATLENNKQYMNITMSNNNDEKKTIVKDLNNNNVNNTNYKNSLSQEDAKFGLTSTDNINLFKQLKRKKFNKALPPININKEDSNMKDVNLSAGDYFEDNKDFNGLKEGPKVMKIIRKKNK